MFEQSIAILATLGLMTNYYLLNLRKLCYMTGLTLNTFAEIAVSTRVLRSQACMKQLMRVLSAERTASIRMGVPEKHLTISLSFTGSNYNTQIQNERRFLVNIAR